MPKGLSKNLGLETGALTNVLGNEHAVTKLDGYWANLGAERGGLLSYQLDKHKQQPESPDPARSITVPWRESSFV